MLDAHQIFHAPGCRLAPEGEKAIEGQKYQPTGAKASNKEGKQPIGPTRGKYVRLPCPPQTLSAMPSTPVQVWICADVWLLIDKLMLLLHHLGSSAAAATKQPGYGTM